MGRITDALKRAMAEKGGAKANIRVEELSDRAAVPSDRRPEYPNIDLGGKVSPLVFSYYNVGGNLIDEFQHIRASVAKNKLKSILVTSSISEDGKTTVALNLGFTVAGSLEDGRRVLLIDTDMHKRPFYDLLSVDMGKVKGLSDAIIAKGDIRDYIVRDEKTGLYLLFAGSGHMPSFNVADFGKIMQDLKAEFDVVIADSLPVLHFVEPREMSSLFDAVIYVVRILKTPRGSVNYGVQCLKDMGQTNIYFVLTGAKAFLPGKKNAYYYYK